jgi:hypothetical protein
LPARSFPRQVAMTGMGNRSQRAVTESRGFSR